MPVTQDLAGTTIRVTAPLISGQDTPRWSDGCARRRIFMDLTDPNLDTTFSIGLRGQALVNLAALFQTYLNQLQQRNNATFLFGAVNVPSGPAAAGPLAPRACDFTVNSQAVNPNNNTLNILLLVDSAQLPDGSGAGLLPNNLAPPGSDALFLLSDYQLLEKFVLPGITAGLQKSDAGSAFSLDWFGFTRNPARASLTGKVGYQGGWFSKFDVYIAHGEVALDIEYRKEKRGFAEIRERVGAEAVASAAGSLLGAGGLATAIDNALQRIELPAPARPAYTAASLPDHLAVAVTLDAPDPVWAGDTAATTQLARYALGPLAAEAVGAPVDWAASLFI